MGPREPGHRRRRGRAARSRPGEALLRRRVRLGVVVARVAPDRGARAPARALRVVDRRPGGAVHPRRPRRRAGDRGHRLQHGRVPRRELRAPARRPVPGRDLPVRQLRHVDDEPRRPAATATTSTGCARASASCSCAARACGRTRPGRSRARSGSRGCSARRASRTSSTSGATTSRTTGRHGARRSRIISPGSADARRDDAPDGTAARHRGGLADGVRDARRPPRPDQGRLRHDPPGDGRADHDGAVRPARQAALRARRRPARVLVLPPARVAEEGRADGRRVPAQQPVHVPGDGEARRLLRDAAARAEDPEDRAGPAQEPARQRALRLHGGEVQPAVRPRRDRRVASATRCS